MSSVQCVFGEPTAPIKHGRLCSGGDLGTPLQHGRDVPRASPRSCVRKCPLFRQRETERARTWALRGGDRATPPRRGSVETGRVRDTPCRDSVPDMNWGPEVSAASSEGHIRFGGSSEKCRSSGRQQECSHPEALVGVALHREPLWVSSKRNDRRARYECNSCHKTTPSIAFAPTEFQQAKSIDNSTPRRTKQTRPVVIIHCHICKT